MSKVAVEASSLAKVKISKSVRISMLELAELDRLGIEFKEAVRQGMREVIHRERKKAGEPPFYGADGGVVVS